MAVFLVARHATLGQFAQNIHAGACGARARGGAGRPVRHRAEQHAAWPVHVRRRRASCGHEPSLQRDDGAVGRSRASRRDRGRHRRTPASAPARSRQRAARSSLRRSRIREARDIITTDPDVARGRSLSWTFQPMADGGAVVLLEDITERRNAEARISHLARYDELTALPNRVNFRDEIERLLTVPQDAEPVVGAAVHRPRPVQAGQRHARPSLRRPAPVRGRRPLARDAAPGGFRGALRRRRIRGVPAEHQFAARRPPCSPGASSIT